MLTNSLHKYILAITLFISNAALAAERIFPAEAKNRIGQYAIVCGKVSSMAESRKSPGKPTFINLGPAHPQHIFTILIWGKNRTAFSYNPELLERKNICVTGLIEQYRGTAQIEVRHERQITIQH